MHALIPGRCRCRLVGDPLKSHRGIEVTPFKLLSWLAATTLWASAASGAATVYRWVDAEGKVHYSEVVPEAYRGSARPLGVTSSNPSAEQERDAMERAQRDKARVAAAAASSVQPAAKPAAASAASRPAAKRPATVPNAQTDCETWQRLYIESADCFGPFRTVRGATKPQAFEICNVVPEPPSHCRLRAP